MKKDLALIIEEKVDAINIVLDVVNIVGTRIYLCNTLHLTLRKLIKDSSDNLYKITDFKLNDWIEVEPYSGSPAQFDSESLECPAICFFTGAPASLNNEYLDKDSDTRDKTPLVWLLENYTEDFKGRESSIERTSRFRLFFLDENNEEEWITKEHHTNVVQPLINLSEAFIDVLAEDRKFKTIEIFTQIPRVRFGKYRDDHGNERKIIDENLSGIELSASFEMFKSYKCKNNC